MDYSFGTWVKRRRKSLDLTQHELARRVGCSVSAIFKIETDERRPSRQIAELLAEHLEIPPDQRAQFLTVARQIKTADEPGAWVPTSSDRASEAAAVPDAPALPASLPVARTSLVGREHELRAITQQVQDPTCRLLTLTGPGGVGKTRLAVEAAHRLEGTFPSGIAYVSLVGTSASEYIIPAIGDALGFAFAGQTDLKHQLFHYLKEKNCLLVLDNLEHLLEGIELLDELLAFAPQVTLLTTSREPLNLRAEWVFEVHGLPIPSPADVDNLEANSAAALFLQRAKQASGSFEPERDDLTAIARICQLVEGLPLGLELAVTWVRVMPVKEIAREIERSMDFLTTTARDMPSRHRSIRAVFDHSWSLLNDEERQVMQRLSVFRGGFTRDAAQQVAGASLPALSSLVDKSLVQRSGGRRYDLHELIRQYAGVHLDSDPAEARDNMARMADYYARLLETDEYALRSERQTETLEKLKLEIDNIRAAWDFAIQAEAYDLLRRGAGGLYYFYELQQFFQEAAALYGRAAEMIQNRLNAQAAPDQQPPQDEQARLIAALAANEIRQAFFLQRVGRNKEATALYRINMERLAPLDEPFLSAYTYIFFGIVSWALGNMDEAAQSFQKGLPVSRQLDHPWLQAIAQCFMAGVEHDQGHFEAAYHRFREAIALCQQMKDPYIFLLINTLFSRTAQAVGRLSQAEELLHESLAVARESGNRWGIGLGLEQMAMLAHASGDDAKARVMLEESVALHREVRDLWSFSRSLYSLSRLALAQQDFNDAERYALEGLRAAVEGTYYPNALESLVILAETCAQQEKIPQAFEMAQFALGHPACSQEARERASKLIQALEANLPPSQAAQARQRAQSMKLEDFIQPDR
jgi:predicted ATPase/transcriptional regulator with XRE-family HTH domain